MSYDFMMMRLYPTPRPGPISAVLDDEAQQAIDSPLPLHDAVRASALFAPSAIRFDSEQLFTWNTPDGGQMDVNVIANIISLRMHAHWDHAAQMFELALGVWPVLVLLDLQQNRVHDPASFRMAIERNDRELAEYRARRDAGC